MAKRTSKASTETKTTRTALRNTAIPKVAAVAAPARRPITHDLIAQRAYEISQSLECRDELNNWLRAERELLG